MPKKRVINKEDYPMVQDWENYKTTHTRLLCKCQGCNVDMYRSIDTIDRLGSCYCVKCGHIKTAQKQKRVINKEDYPMVQDWSNYENTHTRLLCKCQECGINIYKDIHGIDTTRDCYCKKCANLLKTKKTNLEKYGVENTFQSEEIKEKIKEKNLEKYGVPSIRQKSRTIEQINITSSKENFEEYLKTFETKPTTKELTELLGFVWNNFSSKISTFLKDWSLYQYINQYTSEGEKELTKFIETLGFNCEKKKFSWGEVDCFIPSLNIGFEFNGSYWHGDIQKPKNYHYDKVTNAQKDGIRLIMIWDYEWVHKNQQIKNYIKAQLGLCEYRVYARNCIVKEITFKEAKPLLEYHQQGKVNAAKYIGLYYKDDLVLVMLFSKSRFEKNNEWEVVREICKEKYSVVGGKSKVFKYFVKTYNPESIVSFVDRAKFTGKSYQIMGFELEKICEARYDWVFKKDLIFKKRQPRIYRKMKDLYNDEKVFRIYDSGRYKYVWKRKNTTI